MVSDSITSPRTVSIALFFLQIDKFLGRDVKFTLDYINGAMTSIDFFHSNGTAVGKVDNIYDDTVVKTFLLLPVNYAILIH